MLIDFHTHILPGIDDGSRNPEETGSMLREELRQGVGTIVATPHFYAQHSSISDFLKKREEAFEKTISLMQDWETVPKILKAAEVYYFPGMGRAEQLPSLALEGSNLLLVEMPFAQWTSGVYREVRDIIEKQRLSVLLVHMERYIPYQKDKSIMEDVLDLPVYLQINAGSLLNWKTRHIDKKVLKLGLPVVLGSDCHNMVHRPPNLQQGREMLTRKMGAALVQEMEETAERLLKEHAKA